MTSDEQLNIERVCLAITREKDHPAELTKLVAELNDLLERRERRLAESKEVE
jgi:hypothetical protein